MQQSNEESELLSPTKDEKIIEKNSNHAHSSSSQSFARKDEVIINQIIEIDQFVLLS